MKHNHRRTGRLLLTTSAAITLAIGLELQTGCTIYAENPDTNSYQAQPAPPPPPDQSADADQDQYQYEPPPPEVMTVYQDDLNSYGTWVNVEGYGTCWSPFEQPPGWQPYTVGRWEYCDYGWTWIAEGDEAGWGHICYHYGRWYFDPRHGWVWIPGITWAPAWVVWREGDGYCGWAPLPPQCGFGPHVRTDDVDRYVPPDRYVYCQERYVNSPRVDQHFERNNITIINQTTNITNITYVNNTVINRGVSVTNIQNATGHPVEKVQLAQATTPAEARQLAAAGKPVIFAPPVIRKAEQQRFSKGPNGLNTPKSQVPAQWQQQSPGNQAPSGQQYRGPQQNNPPQPPQQQHPGSGEQSHQPPGTKEQEQNNPQIEKQKQQEEHQSQQQQKQHEDEQGKQQQEQQQKQTQEQQQKQQEEEQKKQQAEQQQREQQQKAEQQKEEQQKEEQQKEEQRKQQEQQQQKQQQDQQQKQQQQQQQQQQKQKSQPQKGDQSKPKPKPPPNQNPPS